jgi:hypothetical protein
MVNEPASGDAGSKFAPTGCLARHLTDQEFRPSGKIAPSLLILTGLTDYDGGI